MGQSLFETTSGIAALKVTANIKPARAAVTAEEIQNYFDNLKKTIIGVDFRFVINYDETNLQDDPGKKAHSQKEMQVSRKHLKFQKKVQHPCCLLEQQWQYFATACGLQIWKVVGPMDSW